MAQIGATAPAGQPGQDIPVPGTACASGINPATLSAEQLRNCHALTELAKLVAATPILQKTLGMPALAGDKEASVGKQRPGRGEHLYGVSHEASPITELTHGRLADSSTGQSVLSEALPAILTLPSEPALLELVLQMLTGGNGALAAPTTHFEPAEATLELLVLVWSVVSKLKTEHANEIHMVPGTNGRIDAEEARGFLLGAVLGRGLLERTQAAAAGLDARNKKKAVEKRLATMKEAARKAAYKLAGDERERHTTTAAEERVAIERAPITLELPPPLMPPPPPKPPSAAGRKRAAPAPDPDVALEAWCRRHVVSIDCFKRERLRLRLGRALDERAWRPSGGQAKLQLTQKRREQQMRNRQCNCEEAGFYETPSFLCQVHVCYAFEVGTCDGLRRHNPGRRSLPSARIECRCVSDAWCGESTEEDPPRWPYYSKQWNRDNATTYFGYEHSWNLHWRTLGMDPPPGGLLGHDYCPIRAMHKLQKGEMHGSHQDGQRDDPWENFPSYGKV